AGWTKIQVIWDLSVTALDSASCRYTNQVLSYPTPAFLETLEVVGISFEDAVADRQAASDDHNRRETALYAQSLERKALARNYIPDSLPTLPIELLRRGNQLINVDLKRFGCRSDRREQHRKDRQL